MELQSPDPNYDIFHTKPHYKSLLLLSTSKLYIIIIIITTLVIEE